MLIGVVSERLRLGTFSTLVLPVLFIAGGLACLVVGADVLVRGAAALAARVGISSFVIGLTVVAFGTSMPELVVGVRAAMNGSGGLVFGNVFGSNIANIGLILALAAVLTPLSISKAVRRELLVMLGATLLITVLLLGDPLLEMLGLSSAGGGNGGGVDGGGVGGGGNGGVEIGSEEAQGSAAGWFGLASLGRVDGLLILLPFAWYLYEHVRRGRHGEHGVAQELAAEAEELAKQIEDVSAEMSGGGGSGGAVRRRWVVWALEIGMIVVGLALLLFGGEVVVSNATSMAERLGVEDRVIGVTIVAIGTSLPELAAALLAAYRRHGDMILGNVIGSNIFNMMLILGVSSLVSPLEAPGKTMVLDLPALGLFSVFCAVVLMTGKRMTRWEGVAIGVLYAVYLGCVYFLK